VREAMRIQGEFSAQIAERALKEAEFDAAVFTEPIAETAGRSSRRRCMKISCSRAMGRSLQFCASTGWVPSFFSPLPISGHSSEPCETGIQLPLGMRSAREAQDYRDLRRDFGRDLRLIGGIDLDVLRLDRRASRERSMRRCRPFWRTAVSSLWQTAGFARISHWRITSIIGAASRSDTARRLAWNSVARQGLRKHALHCSQNFMLTDFALAVRAFHRRPS